MTGGCLPIRVAVVDLPQMLSEIVKDILDRAADVAVVDAIRGEEVDADIVILPAPNDELPSDGEEQLERRPRGKILTIGGEGRYAYLYELLPRRTALGELSEATLLAAVRGAQAGWG
jgi:hypothetical protein